MQHELGSPRDIRKHSVQHVCGAGYAKAKWRPRNGIMKQPRSTGASRATDAFAQGPGRFPAAVPGYQDMTEVNVWPLGLGDQEQVPARSEQSPFDQLIELLTRRLPAEQATALAENLSTGTWTHDYPILASTGKSLGLSISTDMPDDVLQLLTLYPQPVRLQNSGGVEYLPVERRKLSESRAG
jgi:Serine dehydrogenase proteinase